MKNIAFVLCLFVGVMSRAQDYSEYSGKIKVGGGYTHDFPGLNGFSAFAEFSRPLNDFLQGSIGAKIINLSGHPRTATVEEYTKANSLDFNLYFVPLSSDVHELRIGAGYSFSFYKIRRSYPLMTDHGSGATTSWPVQEAKGRASGVSLTGEYEYFIPGTDFSAGLRASTFKAYDRVGFVGVFAAVRI